MAAQTVTPVSNVIKGTVFAKMHSLLLSADLQLKLTPGMCACTYTYKDILHTGVQWPYTSVLQHCFANMQSPSLSAAQQTMLTGRLMSLHISLQSFAPHTSVQRPHTSELQH